LYVLEEIACDTGRDASAVNSGNLIFLPHVLKSNVEKKLGDQVEVD